MVIIITALNPRGARSASARAHWRTRGAGAVSAHPTGEEITPQKHVGEIPHVRPRAPPRSARGSLVLPPPSGSRAPRRPTQMRPPRPSWLQALTLCRVSLKWAPTDAQTSEPLRLPPTGPHSTVPPHGGNDLHPWSIITAPTFHARRHRSASPPNVPSESWKRVRGRWQRLGGSAGGCPTSAAALVPVQIHGC